MTVLLSSVRDALKNVDPIAIACVALAVSSYLYFSRTTTFRKPPGPRPMPLIGNMLQMPSGREWIQFTEWYKQYESDSISVLTGLDPRQPTGPIFYLNLLGKNVFVINTHRVAEQVLEKNINSYAHRPLDMVMASELYAPSHVPYRPTYCVLMSRSPTRSIGWERAVALNPGGAQHRHYRKLLSKVLNSTAVRRFRPQQQRSAEALCAAILRAPDDFLKHILKHIPAWFPGAQFKRDAQQWRADLDALAQVPFNSVKDDVASGAANPSYVGDHLSADAPLSQEDEDAVMWTAASLYTGGADTTHASLMAFVLLMCLNPAAQKRAQAEIDATVGTDRLPTLEDVPNLPYVSACVKEVLRYWTVGPIGLPHRATKDEVYDDGSYVIPAGSTVIANIWGMMHDPAVYASPY
ncbi:hypothetical protein EVG20_g10968, partial [Dentipellis fragilis]